jgi:hypothetical protein
MEQQQINNIAIAALERYPDATAIFITNDESAFDDVNKAVANAVALSSGNPEVIEVEVKNLAITIGVTPAKLLKQETIDNAAKQLADAQAAVTDKQSAYDSAEPAKKGAAKNALNKALSNEQAAQTALDLANELPEDEKVEDENKDA